MSLRALLFEYFTQADFEKTEGAEAAYNSASPVRLFIFY